MSEINVDSEKLLFCSNELKMLTKQYEELIKELMQKISDITDKGIWTGVSAERFVSYITTNDKKKYDEFAKIIKGYSNFFLNSYYETQTVVNRTKYYGSY